MYGFSLTTHSIQRIIPSTYNFFCSLWSWSKFCSSKKNQSLLPCSSMFWSCGATVFNFSSSHKICIGNSHTPLYRWCILTIALVGSLISFWTCCINFDLLVLLNVGNFFKKISYGWNIFASDLQFIPYLINK